jgi:hypothetical protein
MSQAERERIDTLVEKMIADKMDSPEPLTRLLGQVAKDLNRLADAAEALYRAPS